MNTFDRVRRDGSSLNRFEARPHFGSGGQLAAKWSQPPGPGLLQRDRYGLGEFGPPRALQFGEFA